MNHFGYVLEGDPSGLDYEVYDFTPPREVWGDEDRNVNFTEYVRKHIWEIVPGFPPEAEFYLAAGRHAHNKGLVALLLMWVPLEKREALPDWHSSMELLNRWCESLGAEEVRAMLNRTYAPSWEQLQQIRRYPDWNRRP